MGVSREALQPVLRHAERLAALLFIYDLTPPSTDDQARRWLMGRAAEVERYAESVVDDWAAGALDEPAAAATLQRYVDAIHEGLASTLNVPRPSCCHAPSKSRRKRARG